MNYNFIDLTGQRFGRLVALRKLGKTKQGNYIWECQCSCGNIVSIPGSGLRYGSTKSCGCLRNELAATRGKKFFEDHKNNWSIQNRKPTGIAAANQIYHNYKARAKRLNIFFDLSFEQFIGITQKDCFYCNCHPSQINNAKNLNGSFTYNGIDRINNTDGYTINNCVPCCKHCNYAKNDFTKEEFEKWIDKVYNHIHDTDRS